MLADCLTRCSGFATVMVIPQEEVRGLLGQMCGSRFQVIHLTDLVELIQYVDVVMHHCGHATLQAVLLAGKPAITLPSGEYDREDNALRLEELACGRHLGHDFFRSGLNPGAISAVVKEMLTDSNIATGVTDMRKTICSYREKGIPEFLRVLERRLSCSCYI